MSANPGDRQYRKTHEWFKVDGNIVTIGITQFAANELTDITYVALPPVGTEIAADKAFGEIESVKATSDLYSAVSGTIVEVNGALANEPELVNSDPFERGWMVKVKIANPAPLDGLMDAAAYDEMTRS